ARVLRRRGVRDVGVESPGFPLHRRVLAANGLRPLDVPVDGGGAVVESLARSHAGAALLTPAHQMPTGVALSPARRAALLDWARGGGLVIEDDYDAEFRYDRAPVGALQGIAPDHVAYLGTASKTLAPALRLAWLVLPAALVDDVTREKELADTGSPLIEQLVLARLLDSARYDRHVRHAGRRNRARRDALLKAVGRHLPGARVEGLAAGLHAIVRLPEPGDVTTAGR